MPQTVKISDVLVNEGDIVNQGQVLVKSDTTDWQNQITTDQHAQDSAKASLIQAQAAVGQAQSNVNQAKANLQTAQYALSMQTDVKAIQDNIDNTNSQFQQSKLMLQQALAQQDNGSISYWQQMINYYSTSPTYKDLKGNPMADGGLLGKYEQQMANLLADPAHAGAAVTTSVADIIAKQWAVQQAQDSLVNAQNTVATAQINVTVAQNKVTDAQTTLDTDKASLQEIDAPFKGLVTKLWRDSSGNILVKGDIVQRSDTLVEIADPNKFEANVLVTERDVTSVVIGGDASVSFDALPGLTFPAKITLIAPLATIQQGVVNYNITVELTSTTPATTAGSPAPSTIPVTLKDGFAAVVNIPVQKKDNILIVPSSAVSHQGQNYVVQVVVGTATETRVVKIGITDFQNTEIIEGLNQGDKVVLPAIPTASPTPGGIFGGGGG